MFQIKTESETLPDTDGTTKLDGTEVLTLSELMESCELLDPVTNLYSCTKCGALIKRRFNLKRHLKSHLPNQIRCTICNQFFTSVAEKKKHFEVKHSSPHICHMCGATFQRGHDLNIHLAKHGLTNNLAMKCPVERCSKTFFKRSMLMYHLNMHNGCKPFKCVHCAKEFYSEYTRNSHQKVCTGDHDKRDFLGCMYCERIFPTKADLLEHEASEHEDSSDKLEDNIEGSLKTFDSEFGEKNVMAELEKFEPKSIAYTSDKSVIEDDMIQADDEVDELAEHGEVNTEESMMKLDEVNLREMIGDGGNKAVLIQHLPSLSNQSIFICRKNAANGSTKKTTFFKIIGGPRTDSSQIEGDIGTKGELVNESLSTVQVIADMSGGGQVIAENSISSQIGESIINDNITSCQILDEGACNSDPHVVVENALSDFSKDTVDVSDISASFLTTDNFVALSTALLTTSNTDSQSMVQCDIGNND